MFSAAALAVDEDATRSESSNTLDKASGVIATCLHSGRSSKRSCNNGNSSAKEACVRQKRYACWDRERA
jgi:hypothetical protein